jgi:hypothetical protein
MPVGEHCTVLLVVATQPVPGANVLVHGDTAFAQLGGMNR